MGSREELVRASYTVIDGYLADRSARWLSEDVVFGSAANGAMLQHGRRAAKAWMDELFESVDGAELTRLRLTVDAGRVAVEWSLAGRDRRGGSPISIPMAGIYDIEDEHIVSARIYYDSAALEAIKDGPASTREALTEPVSAAR